MSGRGAVTMGTPGLLEYIEARCVEPRPDCLIWPDAVDRGYGRMYVDGTAKRVHRIVWELRNGPIPDGLTIDHLCRIRYCINTDHMELVTSAENSRRRHRPPTPITRATHCRNGHLYTDATTGIEKGRRRCLTCRAASQERKRKRRRRDAAA